MDQWLSVDQSYVAPHTRTLAIHRIVHKHAGLPVDGDAIAQAERALGEALATIDGALAGQRYLAGETFSLADVSLMPYVAGLAMVEAAHLVGGMHQLSRWWADVSARPSWQRVVSA
jgi:glutathione S-transferase